jgi:hypothetical protein
MTIIKCILLVQDWRVAARGARNDTGYRVGTNDTGYRVAALQKTARGSTVIIGPGGRGGSDGG